jgi:excisionase family DNA binding protein
MIRLAQAEPRIAYNPLDVARLLGISRDKVYDLIRSGDLPSKRIGRKYVIPAALFEAWLQQADEATR